ncbi:hypothetical protein BGZ73_003952 [Actinomortierella ambigua]|nr:hypothetical protein BGZ73_003952 [Actinomortierella ambigua]
MPLRLLSSSTLNDALLGHTPYYPAYPRPSLLVGAIKPSTPKHPSPKRLFNSCMQAKAALARAHGPAFHLHPHSMQTGDLTWALAQPPSAVTRPSQSCRRYQRSLLSNQQLQQRRLQREQSLPISTSSTTLPLSPLDVGFLLHHSRPSPLLLSRHHSAPQDWYSAKPRRKSCPHRLRRFFLAASAAQREEEAAKSLWQQQQQQQQQQQSNNITAVFITPTAPTSANDSQLSSSLASTAAVGQHRNFETSTSFVTFANTSSPLPLSATTTETTAALPRPSTPFALRIDTRGNALHLSQMGMAASSIVGGVEERVEQEAAAEDEEEEEDDEDDDEEDEDDEEDDGIEIEVNSSSRSSISSAHTVSPRMDDMHHSPHDSDLGDQADDELSPLSEANLAQLEQMKQEGFRELALQTQQHSDVFIAKMVYWESLSPEERASWLASQQQQEQQQQHQPLGYTQSNQQQQPYQHVESLSSNPLSAQGQQGTYHLQQQQQQHCDMDELVAALECRASVKDYSALLVYEKRRLAAVAAAAAAATSAAATANSGSMSSASSFMSVSRASEDSCSMEF